jgi:hypothetical protein
VSPVRYELGFYIPEDGILHGHCRENLKSYIALTGWTLQRRRNVSPVWLGVQDTEGGKQEERPAPEERRLSVPCD